jgi:hypothetical protein
MLKSFGIGRTIGLAIAFAFAGIRAVAAHDFWIDGKKVDPITKKLCCGENDCKMISLEIAHVTRVGYRLDDTGETIPWHRVQISPDGAMWRCRWGGQTQCFFAPPLGS